MKLNRIYYYLISNQDSMDAETFKHFKFNILQKFSKQQLLSIEYNSINGIIDHIQTKETTQKSQKMIRIYNEL